MTEHELKVFEELADAYRIFRNAFYTDMHREEPALNNIQQKVANVLDNARKEIKDKRAFIKS